MIFMNSTDRMTPQLMQDSDRSEVRDFIAQQWHAPFIVVKEKIYSPHECEGFLIRQDGRIAALITYQQQKDSILLLTVNKIESIEGIGTSLVLMLIDEARKRNVHRIWLTTTNDNLHAMWFYQRLGFRIATIYRDAMAEARKTLKPQIPEYGPNGLPIQDEIEMELVIKPYL